MPAYDTAVYPYPSGMWDEAAGQLATHPGWTTVLVVAPDPAGTEADAVREMANRGINNAHALVYELPFANAYVLRISLRVYLDPLWDEVYEHLTLHASAVLRAVETPNPQAVMDDARAAMAERGLRVSVGYAADLSSEMGILRVELA